MDSKNKINRDQVDEENLELKNQVQILKEQVDLLKNELNEVQKSLKQFYVDYETNEKNRDQNFKSTNKKIAFLFKRGIGKSLNYTSDEEDLEDNTIKF